MFLVGWKRGYKCSFSLKFPPSVDILIYCIRILAVCCLSPLVQYYNYHFTIYVYNIQPFSWLIHVFFWFSGTCTMYLNNIYTSSVFCCEDHKKNFDIHFFMKPHTWRMRWPFRRLFWIPPWYVLKRIFLGQNGSTLIKYKYTSKDWILLACF